jgi:hypothetical protein
MGLDASLIRCFQIKPDKPNSAWRDVFGQVIVYDDVDVYVHSSLYPAELRIMLFDASGEGQTIINLPPHYYAPAHWVIAKHDDPLLREIVEWVNNQALDAAWSSAGPGDEVRYGETTQ